jgi:hypothetical protein
MEMQPNMIITNADAAEHIFAISLCKPCCDFSNNQLGGVEPECIASFSKGEIKARTLTADT